VGKRKAVTLAARRVASLMGRIAQLPGLGDEDERYFRDVYDHLIRISDLIDSYRDLLTGMISTILIPLTFMTGFFGQNFGWLVRHIGGTGTFSVLAIGSEILVPATLVAFFQTPRLVRARWISYGLAAVDGSDSSHRRTDITRPGDSLRSGSFRFHLS
jgi:magnesium transporter